LLGLRHVTLPIYPLTGSWAGSGRVRGSSCGLSERAALFCGGLKGWPEPLRFQTLA